MANFSARSIQKPGKLVTYGKGRAKAYDGTNVDSFFEDDGLEARVYSARATVGHRSTVKDSFPTEKAESRAQAQKPVKRRRAPRDTFDVPSSDEEVEVPTKRVSPPKIRAKPVLVDDTVQMSGLPSWERLKMKAVPAQAKTAPRMRYTGPMSPDIQLQNELAEVVAREPFETHTTTGHAESSTTDPVLQPKTAAARLAARKRMQTGDGRSHGTTEIDPSFNANKRAVSTTADMGPSPRKRGRKANDVVPRQATATSMMGNTRGVGLDAQSAATGHDIFSLPEVDDNEEQGVELSKPDSPPLAQKARRGRVACARTTPVKGLSAPERLHTMLPPDSDATDSTARSPSILFSAPSTPTAVTPSPDKRSNSPRVGLKESDTLTPKQARAWDRILPSVEPPTHSPGALPLDALKISGQLRNDKHDAPTKRILTLSSSDITEVPKRRQKLVDRLKAAAFDVSSEDESGEGDTDVVMAEAAPIIASSVQQRPNQEVPADQQASQGQSQSGAATARPRITYARVRSYLPEDSLEEVMALDLPIPSQHTRTMAHRVTTDLVNSQSSAVVPDDSDDETGPARLRSIHELRAAGRNRGFIQDTEALMEDISNHNSSARGARRGAFTEIANKMLEREYVERFIAHGFEQQLAAEFAASLDEVGDFLLAVIISLLLLGEPPQHTLTCLHKAGVLQWLLSKLKSGVEARKIARDRRNNMSKTSQTDFLACIDACKHHAGLWEHTQPSTINSRCIALRSLDLFIRRSRKLGDQSELLTADQLVLVLDESNPAVSDAPVVDISLSFSVLESLAISSLPLEWPESVSKHLAALVPRLQSMHGMPQHTTFLALRLTLNLTNENARNCSSFAQSETIYYFLTQLSKGFTHLESNDADEEIDRALLFDLLILSLGIMTNLADQNDAARDVAMNEPNAPILTSLLATFTRGLERAADAESMEEINTNVAFGYLAILLANLCQATPTRHFVAAGLPGTSLQRLVAAVEEFVAFHEKVDMLQSMRVFDDDDASMGGHGRAKPGSSASAATAAGGGGGGGAEIWGAYTARFKAVLRRLKAVAE